MTELEKLMAEREEIERRKREIAQKIREAKHQETVVGKVKIGIERYPTDLPDRYYVAIAAGYRHGERDSMGRSAWRAVLNGASKEEVLKGIPGLVRDLQQLYDQEANRDEH